MIDKARFDVVADAWEAHLFEVRAASNPRVYIDHPTFDAVVALGPDAIPWIIERYRTGSLFWGAALARITGNSEHGDGVRGDLHETRRRWLAAT
ncbi:MAG TPA: hypothetical protein VGO62_11685 [Myxococcota bacterium]